MRIAMRAPEGHFIQDRLKRVTLEAENPADEETLVSIMRMIQVFPIGKLNKAAKKDTEDLPVVESDIMEWANKEG